MRREVPPARATVASRAGTLHRQAPGVQPGGPAPNATAGPRKEAGRAILL